MTAGHSYRLTVNASDYVENAAPPVTTTFSVISLALARDVQDQPVNPSAEIPPTEASSKTFDVGTGTTFKFTSIPMWLGNFTVNITGTPTHAGYGYLRENVDLTRATISLCKTVTVNGQPQDQLIATAAAPSSRGTVPALNQWRLTSPPGNDEPLGRCFCVGPRYQEPLVHDPRAGCGQGGRLDGVGNAAGIAQTAPLIPPINYPGTCSVTPCSQIGRDRQQRGDGSGPRSLTTLRRNASNPTRRSTTAATTAIST